MNKHRGAYSSKYGIAKVGGKCDISHFPREYVLVNATHPTLLMVPIFQQGDRWTAWVASVSVLFRSKERGARVKEHDKKWRK